MAVIYQTSKARSRRSGTSQTPAAPVSVTATKTATNEITLTWQDPADTTSLQYYKIYRSNGGAYLEVGTRNPVAYPANQTFVNSSLADGTYTYRVSCYSVGGIESAQTTSNSISITTVAPPAQLAWKSFVTDPYPIGSFVQGVAATYPLAPLLDIPGGATVTYTRTGATDTSVTVNSSTGVISIPATLTAGNYSITVDATDSSALAQVGNLVANGASSSVIVLTWGSVTNATGYTVERSPNGTGSWAVVTSTAGTTYNDSGLSPSTTYYYRVKATTATQSGAYSSVASASTLAVATGGDFAARASGPSVVWAHDFSAATEFSQFFNISGQQYPTTNAYTPNYPDQIIPHRVFDDAGFWCIEHINFGGILAANMDTVTTSLTLVDATDFPDPVAFGVSGYRISVKDPNTTSTSAMEWMYVTAKSGNTLTVIRNTGPKGSLRSHTAGWHVGYDSEGRWSRPLSAFTSPSNGKATDDPAASGTVTKRDWNAVTGSTVDTKLGRFKQGYYTHQDYRDKWATLPNGATDWWDGDEFYIQYRVKFSASRWEGANASLPGKIFFLWQNGYAGWDQIVGYMDPVKSTQGETTPSWWWFHAYGDGRGGAGGTSILTSPQGTGRGSTLQPGSTGAATCIYGSNEDLSGCFQWPTDTWVTVLLHVKPGHSNITKFGLSNGDYVPRGSITVNTTALTPTNNGTQLVFETNLVPEPDEIQFPGPEYVSPQTNGYFNNWLASFRTGAIASTIIMRVASYEVVNGRARWTLVASGSTFPGTIPASGDIFALEATRSLTDLFGPDKNTQKLKYHDSTLEAWVAVDGGSYQRVFGPPSNAPGYALVFGDAFVGDVSRNPPGYSNFAPTSYQNLDVGAAPPFKSYSYRFAQIIMSKDWIPPPA